ncbi:MAG: 16S rRNA (uracil(1498)-N(3))-methyltransferase [Firmicutes bacterium HGW-Firmicutes-13]|nr:MAG: 16S rRNA (uracil(1498)-N(3))-methyltransferase [Firmicutes bacterium HGW-Firmicutes-13]
MHRFFVKPEDINKDEGTAVISGEAVKHITRVLRLIRGDNMVIADGWGNSYLVEISALAKDKVLVNIVEALQEYREPPVKVVLAQALAKGEKMDYIVQKCTELGVSEIIPVVTERTVVKLDAEKAGDKILRWRKIARGAAEQSRRNFIPLIRKVSGLKEVLEGKNKETRCIFLWEQEREQGIKEVLRKAGSTKEVMIIVGPEGGFSEVEADLALSWGAVPVTLGPRILRTETAGLAALTIVLYELGDLGGRYE